MNLLLAISNIFCGLLIIGLSIPLARGRVSMNVWYGIRFRKSFESDDYWYRINAYGGKRCIIWSVPVVLIGIVTLFIPNESLSMPLILLIAFSPLLVIFAAIESYLYTKRI